MTLEQIQAEMRALRGDPPPPTPASLMTSDARQAEMRAIQQGNWQPGWTPPAAPAPPAGSPSQMNPASGMFNQIPPGADPAAIARILQQRRQAIMQELPPPEPPAPPPGPSPHLQSELAAIRRLERPPRAPGTGNELFGTPRVQPGSLEDPERWAQIARMDQARAQKEVATDADWDRRVADVNQRGAGLMEGYERGPTQEYTRTPSPSYARKLAERQAKVHQFAAMRALGRKIRQGQPVQIPGMGGGGAAGYSPIAMMIMGKQMGLNPEVIAQIAEFQQRGRQHGQLLASQERMHGAGLRGASDVAEITGRPGMRAAELGAGELAQKTREWQEALTPEAYRRQIGIAGVTGGSMGGEEAIEQAFPGQSQASQPSRRPIYNSLKFETRQAVDAALAGNQPPEVIERLVLPELGQDGLVAFLEEQRGGPDPLGRATKTATGPSDVTRAYYNAPWHVGLYPPVFLPPVTIGRGLHNVFSRTTGIGTPPHMGWGLRKPQQQK